MLTAPVHCPLLDGQQQATDHLPMGSKWDFADRARSVIHGNCGIKTKQNKNNICRAQGRAICRIPSGCSDLGARLLHLSALTGTGSGLPHDRKRVFFLELRSSFINCNLSNCNPSLSTTSRKRPLHCTVFLNKEKEKSYLPNFIRSKENELWKIIFKCFFI